MRLAQYINCFVEKATEKVTESFKIGIERKETRPLIDKVSKTSIKKKILIKMEIL